VQLLHDLHRVLDDFAGNRIHSEQLARMRNELPDRELDADLTKDHQSKMLSGFGIRAETSPWREPAPGQTRTTRKSPQARGYIVRSGDGRYTAPWADAFQRY
jgi:hypothetical protein